MRALALSLLFAVGVSLAAPALTPATAVAATDATTVVVPDNLPWQRIGQWILKNAVTLLMLAEEIWRDLQGQQENPGGTQPPSPSPLTVDAG